MSKSKYMIVILLKIINNKEQERIYKMDLSNENVIHIKKNGIQYLQFGKLLEYSDEITHAYALGTDISYRTLTPNNEELTKEEFEKNLQNYKKICEELDVNYINLIRPNQFHTDEVKIVNEKINEYLPDFNVKEYENCDGLITNKKDKLLVTTNADCILFIFYDPIKKVIANVHSGWKGTLQEISVKTVEKMRNEYDCNPQDVICCICPSIRKCHFEVDEDVKNMFWNKFNTLKEIDKIIEPKGDKWYIDTVLINKVILQQVGLQEKNIIDSGICSVCNCDLIHSFRVEKENYGLEAAIIGLK